MGRTDLLRRFELYAARNDLTAGVRLGSGVHGIVFSAFRQTEMGRVAVKVHEREPDYKRERDIYLRLRQNGVETVSGFSVPELVAYDDELWAIEMTVVDRPFVLDFAGAYLDRPPDFSDEVLADWSAEKQEQFGDHWPEVRAVVGSFEQFGVYLIDVNAGNISFAD